jgi:lysophospholipase L1-like esterase
VSVTSPDGRTQATTIRVRDVLVLGMGDSFSSGEGAPDRPAQLTRLDSKVRRADGFEGNRRVWVPQLVHGEAARWWDDECHRSLLSWQALSALKLASDEADAAASGSRSEQMSVTFASYACSGAEIRDGLIYPQKSPPGPVKADGSRAVQRSQLHAASLDLCDGTGTQIYTSGATPYYYQSCDIRRVPQVVLLSIGGNDAGFAKVVMHTLLPGPEMGNTPPGAAALAAMKLALGTVEPAEARQRANALGESLPDLSQKMQRILGVNPSDVVFMQYPNPLWRPGRLRTSDNPYCGLEMRAGMEAARFVSPVLRRHWHVWGTQKEFKEVVEQMVEPLQQIIESKRGAWRLVIDHLDDFKEHGLCADADKPEPDELEQTRDALPKNVGVYGLPRQLPAADGRVPLLSHYFFEGAYNPGHQRWFRTPNDSVQVQAQPTYGGSLTGAFHPNGSGYARMGDAAYKTMSEVLRGANVAGQ